jgi:pimeloyl-ACP methyl ester carboxylesterase
VTPPQWFTDALAHPRDDEVAIVDGCAIHYLRWGDRSNPGLVLVHGGGAHAHWWTYVAPMFAADWNVVAVDLSGHGDSGHRAEYSREIWADEVMAVAGHAGFTEPPVLVGHSRGGHISIIAAERYGDELAGTIIVDSSVRRDDPEQAYGRDTNLFKNKRVYPDRDTAVGRFRLLPDQPCENDFIVRHIAEHSVHEVEGGWAWKFDPNLFTKATEKPLADYLANVGCRVALIRGELSNINPPDMARHMYEIMHRNAPVVAIPEARHHLMLDQPLAFVVAVRTLLADWDHSTPRARPAP